MSKKKTHEEYVNELKEKNPNIEVIETYKGANIPIAHKCLIDGYVWNARPGNVLFGTGCPKCANNMKFTQEEYSLKVFELNPNIEVIGEYVNARTAITHRCKIHNILWDAQPGSILQGTGCPKCGKIKYSNTNRKTLEEYKTELSIVNPNIEVIGEYKNSNTPILHRCSLDGYEWVTSPSNILQGSGCPMCSHSVHRTHNEYVEEVRKINPNIEVVGKFIDVKTKITHKCLIHSYIWDVVPSSILAGKGCPICAKKKISDSNRKTHEDYVYELSIKQPNIEVLDEYIGVNIPISFRCKIDGRVWKTTPGSILYGCGCPQCNESHGEKLISEWLENHNILYERQYRCSNCKDIKPLPFDFYLPNYNSCIEFDGDQHRKSVDYFGGEEAFKIRVKHDNIKTQYCKDNNIRLLRINNVKDIDEELNNFLLA